MSPKAVNILTMGKKLFYGLLLFLIMIGFSFLPDIANSTPPSVEVEEEIADLLSFLENSDCEFKRNGTWYDSVKAVAHINRKYEYLLKKGLVSTTESFIDRAASKSSMSGRSYLVRCGKGESMESRVWFSLELEKLRENRP
jgi:hypothetical protein